MENWQALIRRRTLLSIVEGSTHNPRDHYGWDWEGRESTRGGSKGAVWSEHVKALLSLMRRRP